MLDWILNKRSKQEQIQSVVAPEPVHKKSVHECELETHLGKLVISVSNEVGNPTVGVGKRIVYLTQAKQPFLVVEDVVTKQEVLPLGIIMSYTEQKFNALNNMDPQGRIAILYFRLEDEEVQKTKYEDTILYSPEEWKVKVDEAIQNWKASKVS